MTVENDVDLERCSCDNNVIREAFRMLQKKDEGRLSPDWDAQKAMNATMALL